MIKLKVKFRGCSIKNRSTLIVLDLNLSNKQLESIHREYNGMYTYKTKVKSNDKHTEGND